MQLRPMRVGPWRRPSGDRGGAGDALLVSLADFDKGRAPQLKERARLEVGAVLRDFRHRLLFGVHAAGGPPHWRGTGEGPPGRRQAPLRGPEPSTGAGAGGYGPGDTPGTPGVRLMVLWTSRARPGPRGACSGEGARSSVVVHVASDEDEDLGRQGDGGV